MPYYHVKIHTKQNPNHWQWVEDLSLERVEKRVLAPYRQGRPITLRGKTTRLEDIERITIDKTDETWDDHSVRKEVTDELITGPPGDAGDAKGLLPPTDTRQVFVVHGRNDIARVALFTFLRSIGLDPLEWSEAVKATGQPTPYIGEILNAAFSRAHAVVVLLTPDDEACLRQQFRSDSDPQHEVEPSGQARPNVLFEAGMAMGRDSNRTILVEIGAVRPFSDIGGRHILRLDNTPQQRQQLAQRLETAGCPVNLHGSEWHTAGDFGAALELARASSDTASAGVHPRLSKDARILLSDATRDTHGIIRKTRAFGGLTIETNGKVFGTSGDAESEANWEEALGELVERGLVKDESHKDTVFRVTREGFHTAQQVANVVAHGVDSSSSDYRRVAHRDSKAVGESIHEREDQAFINAVTDFDDE